MVSSVDAWRLRLLFSVLSEFREITVTFFIGTVAKFIFIWKITAVATAVIRAG